MSAAARLSDSSARAASRSIGSTCPAPRKRERARARSRTRWAPAVYDSIMVVRRGQFRLGVIVHPLGQRQGRIGVGGPGLLIPVGGRRVEQGPVVAVVLLDHGLEGVLERDVVGQVP